MVCSLTRGSDHVKTKEEIHGCRERGRGEGEMEAGDWPERREEEVGVSAVAPDTITDVMQLKRQDDLQYDSVVGPPVWFLHQTIAEEDFGQIVVHVCYMHAN